MLRAFKNQLKLMSEQDGEAFSKRIQERVKSGSPEPYIEASRNLILTMPDLIDHIQRLFKDPAIPADQKKIHGFLLTYLYHPTDFIPWTTHGLFGYLDDAYLTGLVFVRAARNIDYFKMKESSDTVHQFRESVPAWLEQVKGVIPEEAKKIEALADGIENDEIDQFQKLFSEPEQEASTQKSGA